MGLLLRKKLSSMRLRRRRKEIATSTVMAHKNAKDRMRGRGIHAMTSTPIGYDDNLQRRRKYSVDEETYDDDARPPSMFQVSGWGWILSSLTSCWGGSPCSVSDKTDSLSAASESNSYATGDGSESTASRLDVMLKLPPMNDDISDITSLPSIDDDDSDSDSEDSSTQQKSIPQKRIKRGRILGTKRLWL